MKKLILLSLFIIPLLSGKTDNVYICTGKYAKSYHNSKECKGIKSCKSQIKTITFKQAVDLKHKPCKICYKNN